MLPAPPMDTLPMLPLPTDTPPLDTDADSMERDLLKPSQKLMLLFFMVDTDMVMLLDTDIDTMERDLLKPSQKLMLMLLTFMVDMDMVVELDTPPLDMLLTLTDTLLIPLPIPLLASL